ncbi:hypothetical protein D3OALGA1CA_3347 [Olavius algarvensis associated proteobacterium Delta 3]|nr:hypothetical protein D3OALGA1CA_3347 [Olavius algarvensis associated proteobacterium Delta 3]
METEYRPTVIGLFGFTLAGICVFMLYYQTLTWMQRPETSSADPMREKIVLALDESYETGKGRIIYKGLDAGSVFKMGVVIFDLDPNQVYIRRIGVQQAKQGFRLLETRFQLIKAKGKKVRFWRVKEDGHALAMNHIDPSPELDVRHLGPKVIFGP